MECTLDELGLLCEDELVVARKEFIACDISHTRTRNRTFDLIVSRWQPYVHKQSNGLQKVIKNEIQQQYLISCYKSILSYTDTGSFSSYLFYNAKYALHNVLKSYKRIRDNEYAFELIDEYLPCNITELSVDDWGITKIHSDSNHTYD